MNRRSLFKGFAALVGVAVVGVPAVAAAKGHWELDLPEGFAGPIPETVPGRFVAVFSSTAALPVHTHSFSTGSHGWVNLDFGGSHSHSQWWAEMPNHAHARPMRSEDLVRF